MKYGKKTFFKTEKAERNEELLEIIREAKEHVKKEYGNSRGLLKKGNFMLITPQEETKEKARLLSSLRDRVNASTGSHFAAILYRSELGKDNRHRAFTLINILEAKKLLIYEFENGRPSVEDKYYFDAPQVEQEGGHAIITIASRTVKHIRYNLSVRGIPLVKNKFMNEIAASFTADHPDCPIKLFFLKYGIDTMMVIRDEHEIAGYWKIALNKKEYPIIAKCNPFPFPSEALSDYDAALLGQDPELNGAARNICLWRKVKKLGYDNSFSNLENTVIDIS
ncbi:MAG: hypothetical protein PHT54_02375 [Candidatus Nanoarchaeia archaeon]|nr:hypothetical protein [Candidatus Nanoarchaeia archaeon]